MVVSREGGSSHLLYARDKSYESPNRSQNNGRKRSDCYQCKSPSNPPFVVGQMWRYHFDEPTQRQAANYTQNRNTKYPDRDFTFLHMSPPFQYCRPVLGFLTKTRSKKKAHPVNACHRRCAGSVFARIFPPRSLRPLRWRIMRHRTACIIAS
jgi:hypothetical protein